METRLFWVTQSAFLEVKSYGPVHCGGETGPAGCVYDKGGDGGRYLEAAPASKAFHDALLFVPFYQ
ncbi:MAG: hypothetical protein LBE74_02740 [Treponema sp.]|jgi:hypothetical protein|nr:hypothetical protein [Treponema sp.]